MAINPESHVPIYEQIVDHVCGLIAAGVYKHGEALPSVRALAVEMHVNPNTIQRAYQELERCGFLEMRKGVGAFVATGGASAAIRQTENTMQIRFADGIDLGRQTKLSTARIESVFRRALRASGKTPSANRKGASQ